MRPPIHHKIKGFTLLEMLAVMAIVALIFAVALPRINTATGPTLLKATAYQMASLIRQTRLKAIRGQVETAFVLDTGRRSAGGANGVTGAITVPQDVRITHEVSTRCRKEGSKVFLLFLPDGRSCGSQITLAINGMSAIIQTDWLAGKSKVTFNREG